MQPSPYYTIALAMDDTIQRDISNRLLRLLDRDIGILLYTISTLTATWIALMGRPMVIQAQKQSLALTLASIS